MRVLVAQPDADTPLGLLEAPLIDAGMDLEVWSPRFDPPPAGPFDGMILLGSETNPDEETFEPWIGGFRAEAGVALELGIPVLGVCFGAQILAEEAGGATKRMDDAEIGWVEIHPVIESTDDLLLSALPDEGAHMLSWHRYSIELPEGAIRTAAPTICEQAFRLPGRNVWGIQFHFEADERIIEEWLSNAVERLAAGEVDIAGIRAGIERFSEQAAAVARRIGEGFADAVRRHASS